MTWGQFQFKRSIWWQAEELHAKFLNKRLRKSWLFLVKENTDATAVLQKLIETSTAKQLKLGFISYSQNNCVRICLLRKTLEWITLLLQNCLIFTELMKIWLNVSNWIHQWVPKILSKLRKISIVHFLTHPTFIQAMLKINTEDFKICMMFSSCLLNLTR